MMMPCRGCHADPGRPKSLAAGIEFNLEQDLDINVAGSCVFGEYGNPGDIVVGLNWFPFKGRLFRVNSELLCLRNSPVGYAAVPFAVGGKGLVSHANVE